jgi:hypothetical protein
VVSEGIESAQSKRDGSGTGEARSNRARSVSARIMTVDTTLPSGRQELRDPLAASRWSRVSAPSESNIRISTLPRFEIPRLDVDHSATELCR